MGRVGSTLRVTVHPGDPEEIRWKHEWLQGRCHVGAVGEG